MIIPDISQAWKIKRMGNGWIKHLVMWPFPFDSGAKRIIGLEWFSRKEDGQLFLHVEDLIDRVHVYLAKDDGFKVAYSLQYDILS